MIKVAFETLDFQVAHMYTKKFDEDDIQAINQYCENIAEFIKACGWDEESYIQRLMRPEGN